METHDMILDQKSKTDFSNAIVNQYKIGDKVKVSKDFNIENYRIMVNINFAEYFVNDCFFVEAVRYSYRHGGDLEYTISRFWPPLGFHSYNRFLFDDLELVKE